MSVLNILPQVVGEGREEYKKIVDSGYCPADLNKYFTEKDYVTDMESPGFLAGNFESESPGSGAANSIFCGENLEYMCYLIREKGLAGRIKMIYIDPPFFTLNDHGANFTIKTDKVKDVPVMRQQAYQDKWGGDISEYFKMLCIRLMVMRDLLADDGGIFVHLDWHVVHHVKLLMDEIFGEENFVNEIIWHYKSGGVSKRYFARKHDNILYYSKSKKYYFDPQKEKSYNRGYKPYRFKGVAEYEDSLGWYTMVNQKDVWQIDMVGRSSNERVSYATQKPQALIERMLDSCTKEGDLCADFFCGSGTLAVAARRAGRNFICCDSGKLAVSNTAKRLLKDGAAFTLLSPGYISAAEIGAELSFNNQLYLDGRAIVTVTLTDYNIDEKEFMLKGKHTTIAAEILEKDPLALIDFWCVDTNYDGETFRPDHLITREGKKAIERNCDIRLSGDGAVCVKAYDFFGNSMTKVLEYSNSAI